MEIDIYFDLVCPWCYIGRHRFGRALAERPNAGGRVRWRPFQLNPTMPPAGMDRRAYIAAKFGGVERAQQAYGLVVETAERDGLTIRLDRIRRTPNTIDAHRLIRLLADRGTPAEETIDALFVHYFGEGEDIGDHRVLSAVAAGLGHEAETAAALLAGPKARPMVLAEDAAARRMGIQAVPCFVFNKRFALAGAQEPSAFRPLLDLAGQQTAAQAVSSSVG
ncbi:MAG: DsbA family oxidoreductase [Alphaproteobacteria bacterium]|jgi:predicted DsbA family dithiol-disulfide isomerase|nr:DsbA family oxidoreductase [Alphaproteobacteria bacterium]